MSPEAFHQRYEQLREQVLAGRGALRAWGLNLLKMRGVADWVKAVCAEQTSGSPVMPTQSPVKQLPVTDAAGLPEPVQRQLVTVLAEMILRRQPDFAGSCH